MTAPAGTIAPRRRRPARAAALLRDYVDLSRPGVLMLVLLTAPPALALGKSAWPTAGVTLAVLIGAMLLGISCGALNAWYERERDALMLRTDGRPLPAGRVSPGEAFRFGLASAGFGLVVLFGVGGWLPVAVGALTLLLYVAVYTVWLKSRTAQNTVVGAVAGVEAPLIADAADGRIGLWGVVLFAIVFLWQPPHVWAIALYRRREYEAAGFAMMPATVGDRATRRRMLGYVLLLVPLTLLPWWSGVLGAVYASVAGAVGAWFLLSILSAIRARCDRADRRVFKVSIVYLAVLFLAMLIDLILR